MPRSNPKSLPVEVEEIHGKPKHRAIESFNIHGSNITVDTTSDDPEFHGKSVSYEELLILL